MPTTPPHDVSHSEENKVEGNSNEIPQSGGLGDVDKTDAQSSSHFSDKSSELSKVKAELEKREEELKAALEREQRLKKDVEKLTKIKEQLMNLVIEEHEKTNALVIAQQEQRNNEFETQMELLFKERDVLTQKLKNMDNQSFLTYPASAAPPLTCLFLVKPPTSE